MCTHPKYDISNSDIYDIRDTGDMNNIHIDRESIDKALSKLYLKSGPGLDSLPALWQPLGTVGRCPTRMVATPKTPTWISPNFPMAKKNTMD